jgi:membrane associated rhomboid family serine protease
MIPYRDENDTVRTPIVTLAIIAINVLVWFTVQGAGVSEALAASVCNLGLVPGELSGLARPGSGFAMGEGIACVVDPGREPEHILTSMFLHGGWAHIIGNMWFLWLFGNNVEDSMGRLRFVIFYLVCGVGAALAQVLADPNSIVPMVGASGAISGVMGAYIVLYPRVRVFTLVPLGFFITSIALPAWVMLGYWMLLQVLGGLGGQEGGVAFWAHVGGFVCGVLLVRLFARPAYIAEHKARHWRPRHEGFRLALSHATNKARLAQEPVIGYQSVEEHGRSGRHGESRGRRRGPQRQGQCLGRLLHRGHDRGAESRRFERPHAHREARGAVPGDAVASNAGAAHRRRRRHDAGTGRARGAGDASRRKPAVGAARKNAAGRAARHGAHAGEPTRSAGTSDAFCAPARAAHADAESDAADQRRAGFVRRAERALPETSKRWSKRLVADRGRVDRSRTLARSGGWYLHLVSVRGRARSAGSCRKRAGGRSQT